MPDLNLVQWLMDSGGPVVRYRTAVELAGEAPLGPASRLLSDLLGSLEVNLWLDRLALHSNESFHLRHIHGSGDRRYETVMGKLVQLGLHAGMGPLDDRTLPIRQRLAEEIEKPVPSPVTLRTVYTHYDRRLLVAVFLALAGYDEPAIRAVLAQRLALLADFTRQENHQIHLTGGPRPGVPEAWREQIIDPALYPDGNVRLPWAHDIYGLTTLAGQSKDSSTQEQIDTVLRWIFAPAYHRLPIHYGYLWVRGGIYQSKAVGWRLDLPDFSGPEGKDLGSQTLVPRLELLSRFPLATRQPWFINHLEHLEEFRTSRGAYRFPRRYLRNERKNGYWIFGLRTGLGENRRCKEAFEVESTFWMLKIKRNAGLL